MFKVFRSVALGLAILCGTTSVAPHAKAQVITFSPTELAAFLAEAAESLQKFYSTYKQFAQYMGTFQAVYKGLSTGDWGSINWLDVLTLAELPIFDDIDGVDEWRQILAGGSEIYEDVSDLITRITYFAENLDRFGDNERAKLLRKLAQRQNTTIAAWKSGALLKRDIERYNNSIKSYQNKIEDIHKKAASESDGVVDTASVQVYERMIVDYQKKIDEAKTNYDKRCTEILIKHQKQGAAMFDGWKLKDNEIENKGLYPLYNLITGQKAPVK